MRYFHRKNTDGIKQPSKTSKLHYRKAHLPEKPTPKIIFL